MMRSIIGRSDGEVWMELEDIDLIEFMISSFVYMSLCYRDVGSAPSLEPLLDNELYVSNLSLRGSQRLLPIARWSVSIAPFNAKHRPGK